MSGFFNFLSMFCACGTLFLIVSVIALSLPKSRLRTVLNEALAWVAVVLLGLYAVSPMDLLPEVALGPLGLLDDAGAVYLGYCKVQDALKLRQQRRAEDSLA